MADQTPQPPKAKPGSLRDRIAAFEKSSTSAPAPGPAPAPRPKPAGFASWKPKPPSPPSSPPSGSTQHVVTPSAGLSASDAKESITKGGSLKERMAALQGKGAFGAPPPVAPKPAVERPKWKPPPVVQAPVDDDDDPSQERSSAGVAAAISKTISPPVPTQSEEGVEDQKSPVEEGTAAATTEGGTEGGEAEVDPEEEERQRRAAIAARMARLGGARLGMTPPAIGKKPPVRRPTQEEVKPPQEQTTPDAATHDPIKSPEEKVSVLTAEGTPTPSAADAIPQGQPADYFGASKNSGNAPSAAAESPEASTAKSPSMPIPAVPRRTGPPRKKPVKPAPPPEIADEAAPENPVVEDEKPVEEATPSDDAPLPVQEVATKGVPAVADDKKEVQAAPAAQEIPLVEESALKDSLDEASPNLSGSSAKDHQDPTVGSEELKDSEELEQSSKLVEAPKLPEPEDLTEPIASPPTPSEPPSVAESASGTRPPPPSHAAEATNIVADDDESDVELPALDPPRASPSAAIPPLEAIAAAESPEPEHAPVAAEEAVEVDEADEEAARKKRVAERLAKMGGINPFAPPPPRVTSPPQPADPEVFQPETEETRETSANESKVETEDLDENEDGDSEYEPEPTSEQPANTTQLNDPIPHLPPNNRPLGHGAPVQQVQSEYEEDDGDESIQPTEEVPEQASDSFRESAPSPPARPAQPPRRIVPQAPEEEVGEDEDEDEVTDEEADERLAQSQLFIPPPKARAVDPSIRRGRNIQDEDDGDGDGSENDAPPLPVPHRRSLELPPARSVPQPPKSDDLSEPDSDHDGRALPIPPRRAVPPPRIIPPPPPAHDPHHHQANIPPPPRSPDLLTASFSTGSEEVLDEEEGDPIDPSFHSPSRQTSHTSLFAAAQAQSQAPTKPPSASLPPPPPPASHLPQLPPPAISQSTDKHIEEDAEQIKRRTIAERMAKLGGIKFGSAPVPVPVRRPSAGAPKHEHEGSGDGGAAPAEEDRPAELTEEEEERARKERIAAKLAGMGGMRIGMMPMGMGGLPPQRSHILREEPSSPPVPAGLASPPLRSRPPPVPPPSGPDADSETASDDGVKVEAEESEAEEVSYQDAEAEEAPPPVPSRSARQASSSHSHRRESTDTPVSPPLPPSRPPVPAPNRRSSVRQPSGDDSPSLPPMRTFAPQSDYVMVDEADDQDAPPPPPARRASRPPPGRAAPQAPQRPPMTESISSQWELPSIPTADFDFGSGADLSLSWTDAGESVSPSTSHPSSGIPAASQQPKPPAMDKQLSADELMGLWGRVGVQVCEVATTLFEKSKKTLIGDGTYAGFIKAALADVPSAAAISLDSGDYGYLIYAQNGNVVQKRASDIMPGDIVELVDAKLKGHKGLQAYHQNVGSTGDPVLGIIGEFEAKKSKVKVFQANQHVGQQTVESISYRLEDLKSGTVKVYRVLDA